MCRVETFRVGQENALANFGTEENGPPVELRLRKISRVTSDGTEFQCRHLARRRPDPYLEGAWIVARAGAPRYRIIQPEVVQNQQVIADTSRCVVTMRHEDTV